MKRLQFRCLRCGTHAEVELGKTEQQRLRADGRLNRFCGRCHGNTEWRSQGDAERTLLGEAESTAAPSRGRILIIDDDQAILRILEKALSHHPFDLIAVHSAREAVALLARDDYDLILSDIRMPEFSGQQFFDLLEQTLPEYKHRVIFMTGDTSPETLEFLHNSQRPYLKKPLDIPALLDVLTRILAPS